MSTGGAPPTAFAATSTRLTALGRTRAKRAAAVAASCHALTRGRDEVSRPACKPSSRVGLPPASAGGGLRGGRQGGRWKPRRSGLPPDWVPGSALRRSPSTGSKVGAHPTATVASASSSAAASTAAFARRLPSRVRRHASAKGARGLIRAGADARGNTARADAGAGGTTAGVAAGLLVGGDPAGAPRVLGGSRLNGASGGRSARGATAMVAGGDLMKTAPIPSLRPLRRSGRGDATVGGGGGGDATVGGSGESAAVSPVRCRVRRGASNTLPHSKLFLRTRGVATVRLWTGALPCEATRGSRAVAFGTELVRGIGAFASLEEQEA